jgi:hypothetical protein
MKARSSWSTRSSPFSLGAARACRLAGRRPLLGDGSRLGTSAPWLYYLVGWGGTTGFSTGLDWFQSWGFVGSILGPLLGLSCT